MDWGGNLGALTVSGEWWRLSANLFIHFGFIHLAVNLWVLQAIGRFTETLFGPWSFLLIYLGSGILASMTSVYVHPMILSAGASGAIFG